MTGKIATRLRPWFCAELPELGAKGRLWQAAPPAPPARALDCYCNAMDLQKIQQEIKKQNLDGWLLDRKSVV